MLCLYSERLRRRRLCWRWQRWAARNKHTENANCDRNEQCVFDEGKRKASKRPVSQAGKRVCARKRSLHSLFVSAIWSMINGCFGVGFFFFFYLSCFFSHFTSQWYCMLLFRCAHSCSKYIDAVYVQFQVDGIINELPKITTHICDYQPTTHVCYYTTNTTTLSLHIFPLCTCKTCLPHSQSKNTILVSPYGLA